MKTCFKCRQPQPLSAFYTHPMMGDGHLGKCKTCTKRDVAEHRAKNLEKVHAYDRRRSRTPERLRLAAESGRRRYHADTQAAMERQRQYRARHAKETVARNAVDNAVRTGKLKKMPCCICGSQRSEGHHENYDKPLDVVWLCRTHHAAVHRKYP